MFLLSSKASLQYKEIFKSVFQLVDFNISKNLNILGLILQYLMIYLLRKSLKTQSHEESPIPL